MPTLICTKKCFYRDRSIKSGQAVNIPESDLNLDLVKSSFDVPKTPEQAETAKASAAVAAEKARLPVSELKRRLDAMGISYKGNASRESLEAFYASQQGE